MVILNKLVVVVVVVVDILCKGDGGGGGSELPASCTQYCLFHPRIPPPPFSLSVFFFFSFFFVFFVFCVMLPSPGKIDGPEGFKRIKLYPNEPKTF